jgi:hypothetical protein
MELTSSSISHKTTNNSNPSHQKLLREQVSGVGVIKSISAVTFTAKLRSGKMCFEAARY